MALLYIIPAAFAVFVAVILIRTLRFTPPPEGTQDFEAVDFDREAAVRALQALVRCRTVSYYDQSLENDGEFEKLIGLLPDLYPEVFRMCTMTRLPGRALLFHWEGTAHTTPSVMMAHYDVVPVEEENWTKPPFDAVIDSDGVLWGRGALDTKITFNGVLSAANHLIAGGFTPAQDIYFAFSGGEEINGPGAANIVRWFQEHDIAPALVVDEGGAVVEDVFPGVSRPCALVGIAEKGMLNLNFKVASPGGHASAPQSHTPIGILSQACCRTENHPFRMHITKPVAELFDTLGRHSTFLYRMIFANLWCFGGVLDRICKKSGGELNALVRTTVAFTQATGSRAPNVIPPAASLVANLRLNPQDSIDSAVAYIKSVLDDERVQLSVGEDAMSPSPISETGCLSWDKVTTAISGTWHGCIVSPYLMVQCSDSHHYSEISKHVYRFSACDMTEDERHSIHGNDEHIRVETALRAVEFYIRLINLC